jgi:hypothetical protein
MNSDPARSARNCGCDPGCGAGHICEAYPNCTYGFETGAIWRTTARLSEMAGTAAERKKRPLATGVLDYFPDALMEVAHCSYVGNEQHNPGQPLHWDRNKSTDEPDALLRHLKDRGKRDSDGVRHSAKVAWRALAALQKEIEADR